MTLAELILEYKNQAKICFLIDYSCKKSVQANNNAIDRMYEIVDMIKKQFGQNGTDQFQRLLDMTDYKINVWAATHLLEKLKPDQLNENKALKIINQIAKGDDINALGFSHWLKNWNKKK